MYYPDLSDYVYFEGISFPDVINVGWLDEKHKIATGTCESRIIDKLVALTLEEGNIQSVVNVMRGVHSCPFCGKRDIWVGRNGRKALLGNAELWIPSTRKIYVAPNLIIHYIDEHQYRPPAEFLDAVAGIDLEMSFHGQERYDKLAREYYDAVPGEQ